VNPTSLEIGWHIDWANGFPFAALGLPDNYQIPMPSLYRFGFGYGPAFVKAVGEPWAGVVSGEKQLAMQAKAQGVTESRYKAMLQARYRQVFDQVKQMSAKNSSAGEEQP
jgi:hypothetical protein